jgi:flagellar motor switch protein FliN/FliY
MNDTMTQHEIDELIRLAALPDEPVDATGDDVVETLSSLEVDALGEISNISMGAAATALHTILGRKVVITIPDVTVTTVDSISDKHAVPFVMVDVEYAEGFAGHNLFILKLDDVKVITDIMLGGAGEAAPGDLSELHLSAISEAMNQMMGGVATAMADLFSLPVNISPPKTRVVMLSGEEVKDLIGDDEPWLIRARFRLEIEDLLNSDMMQLMPVQFGRQLVGRLLNPLTATPPLPFPPAPNAPNAPTAPNAHSAHLAPAYSAPAPVAAPKQPVPPMEPKPRPAAVNVQPVHLASFDQQPVQNSTLLENGIDLILDVPLQVTVELGQCRKSIKEILDLKLGSIVALDRLAGEPVDVVVNGKTVAKGEVIVIDDNYGVRITEVLSVQRQVRMAR